MEHEQISGWDKGPGEDLLRVLPISPPTQPAFWLRLQDGKLS